MIVVSDPSLFAGSLDITGRGLVVADVSVFDGPSVFTGDAAVVCDLDTVGEPALAVVVVVSIISPVAGNLPAVAGDPAVTVSDTVMPGVANFSAVGVDHSVVGADPVVVISDLSVIISRTVSDVVDASVAIDSPSVVVSSASSVVCVAQLALQRSSHFPEGGAQHEFSTSNSNGPTHDIGPIKRLPPRQ